MSRELVHQLFGYIEVSETSAGEGAFVAEIGPELAQTLLHLNFKQNRVPSKLQIAKYATDMTNGQWALSNDALVISSHGELGNCQHRLQAVIESGTTQKFIILYGVDKKTFQKFDVGRKRTMEQRITISGVNISIKECAIIRHAMNDYTNSALGTAQYGDLRFDELVKSYYLKHQQFLKLTDAHKPAGSSFFWAAALKIYAEMIHCGMSYNFDHDHDALTRARLFIDMCVNGQSTEGFLTGPHESAAIKLRDSRAVRAQEYANKFWNDKYAWQLTMTAAYKFMCGHVTKSMQRYKTDPFHKFIELPSTNSVDYECEY